MDQEPQVAQRDARGRMLAPLPGGAPPITPDTARDMVRRRVEKYRIAAVKTITGEIAREIDPSVSTGAQAFGVIVAKQARALAQSKDPNFDQVEKLRRLMTADTSSESRRENGAPPGAITVDPSALMELVRMIEQDKRAAIDQASAIDGESNA